MTHRNEKGQPIGAPLPGWTARPDLPRAPITGRRCDVVPLQMDHAVDLHRAFSAGMTGTLWTYMPEGPFPDAQSYADWVAKAVQSTDPLFFAVIDKADDAPVGVAGYLRMQPAVGVAEVGYITFAPRLQRTAMATEALYLMIKQAFALGYRRFEWKCDALNAPSRAAAKRLGFTYEGTFRQATVYKNRNRDTAWFAIIDQDWPGLQRGFEAWLDPRNFDAEGRQKTPLSDHIPRSGDSSAAP
ncbi:MAG: GNAT family protein [Pseudomonadota bacterium]